MSAAVSPCWEGSVVEVCGEKKLRFGLVEELTGGAELQRMLSFDDEECRQRLLSDLVNTGVVATLLTGFSYDTWVVINAPPSSWTEIVKDVITFATIQTSMLSSISATLLYKKVSALSARQAKTLLATHRIYFKAPHISFCFGSLFFLCMVLLFGVMSTTKVYLKLLYTSMSVGCPLIISLFFINMSKIDLDRDQRRRDSQMHEKTRVVGMHHKSHEDDDDGHDDNVDRSETKNTHKKKATLNNHHMRS